MLGIVLGLLLLGFALSAPFTGVLARLGMRVGALDTPGAKGHVKELRKVPNIGGIAIFWSTVLPLATGLLVLFAMPERVVEWAPAIEPYLARAQSTQGDWAVILIGALALHIMGLYDDRRALAAWPKLFLQLAVAFGTTVFSDVRLLYTFLEPSPGGEVLSIVITVAWIIVIVNAVNFIDNMDGLAAGIGAIAAL